MRGRRKTKPRTGTSAPDATHAYELGSLRWEEPPTRGSGREGYLHGAQRTWPAAFSASRQNYLSMRLDNHMPRLGCPNILSARLGRRWCPMRGV